MYKWQGQFDPAFAAVVIRRSTFEAESVLVTPATPFRAVPLLSSSGYKATTAATTDTIPRGFNTAAGRRKVQGS